MQDARAGLHIHGAALSISRLIVGVEVFAFLVVANRNPSSVEVLVIADWHAREPGRFLARSPPH
jgi:hypothetical protein